MSQNQEDLRVGDGARKKATWDDKSFETFVRLCIEETRAGNRPGSSFNRNGWKNIETKFNEITKKNFKYKQFRNKWDSMKQDWQIWVKLNEKASGLGWNAEKKTIRASDEWWEEKKKVILLD
jgi:hypothetical protein